jgi:hypothetical protein
MKEYQTIKIANSLCDSKSKIANIIDSDLHALPKVIKKLSLSQITSMINQLVNKSNKLAMSLCKNKDLTYDSYQAAMIKIKAYHYNISMLKEVRSGANIYIQSTIFIKSDLQSELVTVLTVLDSKIVKPKDAFKKELQRQIEEINGKIKQCENDLNDYNSSIEADIELIDIKNE